MELVIHESRGVGMGRDVEDKSEKELPLMEHLLRSSYHVACFVSF